MGCANVNFKRPRPGDCKGAQTPSKSQAIARAAAGLSRAASKGNGSIILLRRVCHALGAHLEDLLPVDPSPDLQVFRELLRNALPDQITTAKEALAVGDASARKTSVSRVALIGLRGAGKSTLGRILAGCFNWNFINLNKEIEREAGLALPDIIAFYGEEGFRRLGETALQHVLARGQPMVLATGSGIVSEPATFDLILSSLRKDRGEDRRGAAACSEARWQAVKSFASITG